MVLLPYVTLCPEMPKILPTPTTPSKVFKNCPDLSLDLILWKPLNVITVIVIMVIRLTIVKYFSKSNFVIVIICSMFSVSLSTEVITLTNVLPLTPTVLPFAKPSKMKLY